MPVCFHSLEELSDYCDYDFNGRGAQAFSGSETVFGDFVYQYLTGADFIECEIFESLSQGDPQMKSAIADRIVHTPIFIKNRKYKKG